MTLNIASFNNTLETISRPVTRQVVRSVGSFFGVTDDTPIYMLGTTGTRGSTQATLDPKKEQMTSGEGLVGITVEFDELHDEDSLLTTAITQPEQYVLFHDKELGVVVRPIYAKTRNTVSFTARFDSRSAALKWRNAIAYRINNRRTDNIFTVEYYWEFPQKTHALLKTVHALRENQAGYGDTAAQYFAKCFRKEPKLKTDQAGKSRISVFQEKQKRVSGHWKFEEPPEVEKPEQANERWSVTFEYEFEYSKPVGLATKTPIMIHNQLLPSEYINGLNRDEQSINENDYAGVTTVLADQYNRVDKNIKNRPFVIPDFDDWFPDPIKLEGLKDIGSLLCQVTDDEKRELFSFNDMGDHAIDPDILAFMRATRQSLLTLYDNPLHVVVHEDTGFAGNKNFEVRDDLMVVSDEDLNLRKTYRIRLCLLVELWKLNNHARDVLCLFPEACIKLLLAIEPKLTNSGYLPTQLGPRITRGELDDAIYFIRYKTGRNHHRWLPFPTVNRIIMEVDRADRYPSS